MRDRARSSVLGVMLLLLCGGAVLAAPPDDRYILGYATAILEQQFKIRGSSVEVSNGVVTIQAKDLPATDHDKIEKALQEIRGVARVEFVERPALPPSIAAPDGVAVRIGETTRRGGEFLPSGRLFDPLIADPRWPQFSAAYQHYLDDDELDDVGAVSLGATIGIYENDFPGAGRWQVGIQGAVFAIFDLNAPSSDLINADYWFGIPLSYRHKDFSTHFRVYHQSSHLGDEFVLRNRAERINLSYEGIDLLASYDLFKKVTRLYGGGGYLLRTEPTDLARWGVAGGVELRSPRTILSKFMRPVAGVNVQSLEQTDWNVDLSARAGLQFEAKKLRDRYFQLMFEYYNGRSPNGQFFERRIEYWGIGIHFYYD